MHWAQEANKALRAAPTRTATARLPAARPLPGAQAARAREAAEAARRLQADLAARDARILQVGVKQVQCQ
jgi:hypothetical protein